MIFPQNVKRRLDFAAPLVVPPGEPSETPVVGLNMIGVLATGSMKTPVSSSITTASGSHASHSWPTQSRYSSAMS